MGPQFLATALVLGPRPAAEVDVRWSAPVGCPAQQELRSWIDALVAPGARGLADASVQPGAEGYRLTLVVTTEHGELTRTFDAPTCESLAAAAAVVIAVAVDPLEAAGRSAVPPAPPRGSSVSRSPIGLGSSPRPRTDAARRAAPAVESRPDRRPRALVLGAAGGVGTGTSPGPHAVAHAWIGPTWPHLDLIFGATHRFARSVEQPQGGGASISTSSASVHVGPVVGRGRWAVHVHAGIAGGAMVAAGHRLDRNRTAVSPWLGIDLEPGVRFAPTRWLSLWGAATFTGSILRPSFRVDDGPLLHETSLLGLWLGLGLEFRVPLDQSRVGRRLTR